MRAVQCAAKRGPTRSQDPKLHVHDCARMGLEIADVHAGMGMAEETDQVAADHVAALSLSQPRQGEVAEPTSQKRRPWQDVSCFCVEDERFEELHPCGTHYVVRVTSGLESFAATEVSALGATDIIRLHGRVLFSSQLPVAELQAHLRSAEGLSLLGWAAPAPSMPQETARWLECFYRLCCENLLPRVGLLERAWRAATARTSRRDGAAPMRFRVSAKRAGGCSTGSVTSQQARRPHLRRLRLSCIHALSLVQRPACSRRGRRECSGALVRTAEIVPLGVALADCRRGRRLLPRAVRLDSRPSRLRARCGSGVA